MKLFSGDRHFDNYRNVFPKTCERIINFTEKQNGVEEMDTALRDLFAEDIKKIREDAEKEKEELKKSMEEEMGKYKYK